jgi:hypothetical protein
VTDREERLEEALLRIRTWAKAYPVAVFAPVSHGDLMIASTVLKAAGLSMDALHASWARHILDGIDGIIDKALTDG